MLQHYFKIATRNLLKYRLQSMISMIGLALGFTSFALATLWIRYEMTYDTFHNGAEQIFLVRYENKSDNTGLSSVTPSPLAAYLQETFPEIEYACNTSGYKSEFKYKDITYPSYQTDVDSAFMKIFHIQVLSGNSNFLIPQSKEIAITEELANQLFGEENPVGKKLTLYGEDVPICAVVKAWGKHSNIPFEILKANYQLPIWYAASWNTYIKLRKGVDSQAFCKKIYEHIIEKEQTTLTHFILTPIIRMRYDHPLRESNVKFNHILLFALSGGLVILCSLFNYLALFISRIRMRGKEIALRKVCGSSDKHLMSLFSIEYILTLSVALFIGMLLVELVLPTFRELSEIHTTTSGIYMEAICYSGIVALLSFLFSLYPIYYFRRQSLHAAIKGAEKGDGKIHFQKLFIVFQFIISISFIFCTIVMIKQIHFLSHTDRVIERKGKGTLTFSERASDTSLREELKQIPMLTDILPGTHDALIPRTAAYFWNIKEWDEKPTNSQEISAEVIFSGKQICSYYNLTLLQGTMLREDDSKNKVMVNETAVRQFGWKDAIGKSFQTHDSTRMLVVGVIRDFCKETPTVAIKPIIFAVPEHYKPINSGGIILFNFRESQWKACKQRIETLLKDKHPEILYYSLYNTDEEYNLFLQSENALIKLLDFVSVVCIIISIFGIFSLVTLNCERRRKEIVVRKVNGATAGIIIRMFFKEYMLLLCLATLIAFPASYLIMKSWMENYVLQTAISVWIYLVIFITTGIIITLCVGWRIWSAANQNPATAMKSE